MEEDNVIDFQTIKFKKDNLQSLKAIHIENKKGTNKYIPRCFKDKEYDAKDWKDLKFEVNTYEKKCLEKFIKMNLDNLRYLLKYHERFYFTIEYLENNISWLTSILNKSKNSLLINEEYVMFLDMDEIDCFLDKISINAPGLKNEKYRESIIKLRTSLMQIKSKISGLYMTGYFDNLQ